MRPVHTPSAHTRRSTLPRTLALVALALSAPAAWAQDQPQSNASPVTVTFEQAPAPATVEEAVASRDRWSLRVEPAAWYAGLAGDFALPRGPLATGSNPSTRFRDAEADDPILTPLGEARYRHNDWMFGLRGFAFSREASSSSLGGTVIGTTLINGGDIVETDFEMLSADFEVGYRVVQYRGQPRPGGFGVRADLDLIAGARLSDVELSIRNFNPLALPPPGSASTQTSDEFWAEPILGARLELEFIDQLGFDLHLLGGAMPLSDRESYSVDIMVGFWWEPVEHLAAQIGYRAMFFGISTEDEPQDFTVDASLQGLYGGIVLRF